MKKAKNFSALILVSAMLCYLGVLIGCDNNSGSVKRPNPGTSGGNGGSGGDNSYVSNDVYAPGFYATEYDKYYVRDVFRTESSTSLYVYHPGNPYRPDDESQYTVAGLNNVKYFVLEKSEEKDRYDEYAVSLSNTKTKIGTGGRIQYFGKEGFLFLCGGSSGTYYGTFFFTKYGYEKFTKNDDKMTYEFDKLNLTHADVSEIFGSAH